ncbi:MAG: UpxY family transcription antiterminator [Ferruginibacter sp.]
MKKNWYAVYTKPHCELKVAALLSRKKIDNYCPVNRVEGAHLGRKKLVYQPLFPSFVFVYITDAQLSLVRQTHDVINCVYWLGKPALIKEAEIKGIQYFTSTYSNISLEKTLVNPGAMMRTINEPVPAEKEDLTTDINAVNIKLSLPSLGYILVAETENAEMYDYAYGASKMVS